MFVFSLPYSYSACKKEEKTFTTTCDLTSDSAAFDLGHEEYVETYKYNQDELLEILVNGESVEKGMFLDVGDSIYSLYGSYDTLVGLDAECSNFYWD